jgi:kynureninase
MLQGGPGVVDRFGPAAPRALGERTMKSDELLKWRDEFPALEGSVYMISHSLGCMPQKAAEYMGEYLAQWQEKSITAWDDWLPEVERAGARIGKLLSAPEGTVVMHQNVSHVEAILASCFDFTPERNKVVYSEFQFPTVSYVWKAEERRGAQVEIVKSSDGVTIDTEAMCDAIDERTVCVPISHALFSSSYIQDVKTITRKAQSVGAHVILDCYQSLGTIPIDIVDLGVSFATGGSVKFLCGGPGAAYLYVRKDLIPQFQPRVTGWFGHQLPFAFTMPEQRYADSIWRYMAGTPAVGALYQARAGHEIIGEIGARAIREKNQRQTQRVVELVDAREFKLNSPRDPDQRAGFVAFDFTGAADICRELNRHRFFCDHRPGVGIRVSPHFYTRDEEIDLFFEAIDAIRSGRSASLD